MLQVKYFRLKRLRCFLENAGEARESLAGVLETDLETTKRIILGDGLENVGPLLIEDAIRLTEIYAHELEKPYVNMPELKMRLTIPRGSCYMGGESVSINTYLHKHKRLGVRKLHMQMFDK